MKGRVEGRVSLLRIEKIMKTGCKLVSYKKCSSGALVVFELFDSRKGNTLTMNLNLEKGELGWKGSLDFSDLPFCDTSEQAAKKIGDWAERISHAISQVESFDNVDINKL